MLGQPMFLPQPVVIGVRTDRRAAGRHDGDRPRAHARPQMLRAHGVVGKFVEFFGDGLSSLSIADRATLSNMCPEYGATSAYFPVDDETLRYLAFTGRGDRVDLVERYAKEQGLFRRDGDPEPVFSEILDLDLSTVVPSMAGPKRPQDRVPLPDVWDSFVEAFRDHLEPDPKAHRDRPVRGRGRARPRHEAPPRRRPTWTDRAGRRAARSGTARVVIAAITSLHEHVEPERDARRRAARAQGGRGGPRRRSRG